MRGTALVPHVPTFCKRAEILAALADGVTLVAISIWIFIEAYQRLQCIEKWDTW
jgi:Co/Zn/Cd efflux system component